MDNSILMKLLNAKKEELTSKLKESKVITHPTSKGDNSEKSWEEYLKEILSKKYEIVKGFAIDYKGKVSEQIDLIIYDALYSPLIFKSQSGEKYIPVEGIYAIVEIKPEIDKDNLEYANKKIQSVKDLERTSRGMTVAGKQVSARPLTNILGIILSSSSSIKKQDTLKKHLESYRNIDLGCVLDAFSFYCKRNREMELENINFTNKDESLIGLFFHLYNELHKIGTVGAIDIRKYADVLNSVEFFNKEGF